MGRGRVMTGVLRRLPGFKLLRAHTHSGGFFAVLTGVLFTGFLDRQKDLSEIFDRIILVSYRNGRARVGQGERRTRTVLKLDSELCLSLMNGFHFAPR